MIDETVHRLPECNCPACDKEISAATGIRVGSPPPTAGDYTVCSGCATLLVFTKSLGLGVIRDPAKLPNIHPDDLAEIRKTQWAVRKFNEGEPN